MSDDDGKLKLKRSGTALDHVRSEYACPKGHSLLMRGPTRVPGRDAVMFTLACRAFDCLDNVDIVVDGKELESSAALYLVGRMRRHLDEHVAHGAIIRVVAEGIR